jgi:hypothetical protein
MYLGSKGNRTATLITTTTEAVGALNSNIDIVTTTARATEDSAVEVSDTATAVTGLEPQPAVVVSATPVIDKSDTDLPSEGAGAAEGKLTSSKAKNSASGQPTR